LAFLTEVVVMAVVVVVVQEAEIEYINRLFIFVFLLEMKKINLPIDLVIKTTSVEVLRPAKSIGYEKVPVIYARLY
jgi:hypothetical protein